MASGSEILITQQQHSDLRSIAQSRSLPAGYDLARKLRHYINAYSANARPIQWKYSDPTRRVRSNELTATGH